MSRVVVKEEEGGCNTVVEFYMDRVLASRVMCPFCLFSVALVMLVFLFLMFCVG